MSSRFLRFEKALVKIKKNSRVVFTPYHKALYTPHNTALQRPHPVLKKMQTALTESSITHATEASHNADKVTANCQHHSSAHLTTLPAMFHMQVTRPSYFQSVYTEGAV